MCKYANVRIGQLINQFLLHLLFSFDLLAYNTGKMSAIKWFIRVVFWLQAFAGPVILSFLLILVINSTKAILPLLLIGALGGIILAEFIRRKYGLETFFARIYGPNEMDKKRDAS